MMNNKPLSDEQETFARKTFIEPVLFADAYLARIFGKKKLKY